MPGGSRSRSREDCDNEEEERWKFATLMPTTESDIDTVLTMPVILDLIRKSTTKLNKKNVTRKTQINA